MARRSVRPDSIIDTLKIMEYQGWQNETQIIRRVGIEVSWARIANVMISSESVESGNFVTKTSGWKIDGAGNAEFNNVTVRGDIASGNWNGADPANLVTRDTTATTGFYLDSSVGAAQFAGDVFIGGDLIQYGSSLFTTGETDSTRIEFHTEAGDSSQIRINYYVDDGSLIQAHQDKIEVTTSSSAERRWYFGNPTYSTGNVFEIVYGSTAGMALNLKNGDSNPSYVRIGAGGTAAVPTYGWYGITGYGMNYTSSELQLSAGSSYRFKITPSGIYYINRPSTTSSAANLWLDSSTGQIKQSTSARRYKRDIDYDVVHLANYRLKPATFYSKNDKKSFIGFIADDLEDVDSRLATYDNNGKVEAFDTNAVLAVMAAKINRLEEQVAELKTAA